MKYYLVIPAVVLLAAVVYLFFLYDPNSSKNSNNRASTTPDEPKQIDSSEIGTSTVTGAVDFKIAPVTVPSAEELSDETESMENFVSAADDNTTEETTLSATVDDSTEELITSAAVDESMEETITSTAAEESIEDSSTEDITVKRVAYVETDSFDSPQADTSTGDDSRETALQVEEMQPQSIVADDQKQLSGDYIERQAVITSSLSQATSDAGLSANQSARIGRVFEPYLDSRRELRKGDKLTIVLDPGAGKTGNDADHIHRLEFHGARKTLVVTRKEGSLSDYEVRNADGKMLSGKVSQASLAVEKPRRETSVEPAPRSAADNNASTGSMKRIEGVVSTSIFSAAREAGLNAGQINKLEEILTPYINFNKEVRKGDRIVITLDGSEIYSSEFIGVLKKLTVTRGDGGAYRVKQGQTGSVPGESSDTHNGDENSGAKKPFWKRWSVGSSNGDENSSARKPFWKRLGFGSSTELSNEN